MSFRYQGYDLFRKSALGLIFFFIAGNFFSQNNAVVLQINPEDKDIAKRINTVSSELPYTLKKIKFSSGVYYLSEPLNLSSNTILQGDSTSNTKIVFDLGGEGNCINIVGDREKSEKLVGFKYFKNLEFDSYYKVYNSSTKDVGLSTWGKESFGKVIAGNQSGSVLAINETFYDVENKVLGDSVFCYKIKPVKNVMIRNLSIERSDESKGQTSNIFIKYAVHCDVINIDSKMANYSHITIEDSYGCTMFHNRFSNSFSHGNGGKGYGITLQFGATNNEVSGCMFDSLRHGVVLQLGANRNWIVENYFQNGFWEDVRLPKGAAGDIVLHGNYPYMNFIEGNICNNIVIDNSHGKNGPSNLFQYNKTLRYGVYMNKKSVDGITYVIENELKKKGCFKGRLKYHRNVVESCGNHINDKVKKNIGDCEHASTKEYLLTKIKQSKNDATEYFGITIPEN